MRAPRLRIALSFHPLLIGGNPFTASGIYTLIAHLERQWGVWHARGGTGALVRGLSRLIVGQGGEIRLGAEVSRIVVRDGRAVGVALRSGAVVSADIVVSNACAGWTYRFLLPSEARRRWTDRRIERSRYSMGLFVWYFGTRRRFPDVPHHTIILGPRYQQLLDEIFRRKTLGADFSLYLHRPTATDPSLAPPGCDCFYALAPVPNLLGRIDWRAQAEPFRQAIARRLEQTVLPSLSQEVVTSRIATPLDFEHDFLSFRGAGFGMEPVLTQSAWFRPHNRSEDVAGLYLVGAGTHPGAGVPGVLSSARILDAVVPNAARL